ncbi:MAG: DNA repair exonuclease [Lachnospiraceae bacterium]|nr:DNA repair exonuclease [Lachnospiraceae bacterium]
MKFIHIADVHLGVKPDKGKSWGKEREEHSWKAFADVITRVKEEQIPLLLIAGDLFHRQPLMRELKEVSYQFSRIPKSQVVMIAGNHDYLHPDSYYRTYPWGENVHFLKEEKIDYVELEELGVRVYGLSYWHKEIRERLYDEIKVPRDDYRNILLAHGGDEKHIPFQTKTLEQSFFDYVAMGHIHKPMELSSGRVVMAGALQPIDCNDTGEHGYFVGEMEGHVCQVQFCPLRYCEYISLNLKVSREVTKGALREIVLEQIKKSKPYQIFRITFTGFCDPDIEIDTREFERMERVAKASNLCRRDYDFEKLKQQFGQQILGRYIQVLEEMSQDEITKKALYYGVEALLAE